MRFRLSRTTRLARHGQRPPAKNFDDNLGGARGVHHLNGEVVRAHTGLVSTEAASTGCVGVNISSLSDRWSDSERLDLHGGGTNGVWLPRAKLRQDVFGEQVHRMPYRCGRHVCVAKLEGKVGMSGRDQVFA